MGIRSVLEHTIHYTQLYPCKKYVVGGISGKIIRFLIAPDTYTSGMHRKKMKKELELRGQSIE